MALWMLRLFERYGYRRAFERERRRRGAAGPWPAHFAARVSSLDTPIRLAGFMEEELRELGELRLFDVPKPAVATWEAGGGNSADWARFAQEVLSWHGAEALLFTVAKEAPLRVQVACAVRDEDTGGWWHLSNLGLFGLYADWEEVADDLLPGWQVRFVRDRDLNLVEEARPQRSGPLPPSARPRKR